MISTPTNPAAGLNWQGAAPAEHATSAFLRNFGWLNRSRRVLLALACTWVIHVFDLGFTQLETHHDRFRELNPIAARFLHNPQAVTIYKFSLLAAGTLIVLSLRRWPVAEMGAWFILATSLYLAVRWHCYYASLASGIDNPFITCG